MNAGESRARAGRFCAPQEHSRESSVLRHPPHPPPTDEPSDAALVRRAQAGDDEALDLLIRRHRPGLVEHAARTSGDASEAEDLCQLACIRALQALPGLQHRGAFHRWLLRILDDEVRNWHRACARRHWPYELLDEEAQGLADVQADPGAEHDHAVLRARLGECAARMAPPCCRVAAALLAALGDPAPYHAGGMVSPVGNLVSHRALALSAGINLGTLARTLYSLRRTLRADL